MNSCSSVYGEFVDIHELKLTVKHLCVFYVVDNWLHFIFFHVYIVILYSGLVIRFHCQCVVSIY